MRAGMKDAEIIMEKNVSRMLVRAIVWLVSRLFFFRPHSVHSLTNKMHSPTGAEPINAKHARIKSKRNKSEVIFLFFF